MMQRKTGQQTNTHNWSTEDTPAELWFSSLEEQSHEARPFAHPSRRCFLSYSPDVPPSGNWAQTGTSQHPEDSDNGVGKERPGVTEKKEHLWRQTHYAIPAEDEYAATRNGAYDLSEPLKKKKNPAFGFVGFLYFSVFNFIDFFF